MQLCFLEDIKGAYSDRSDYCAVCYFLLGFPQIVNFSRNIRKDMSHGAVKVVLLSNTSCYFHRVWVPLSRVCVHALFTKCHVTFRLINFAREIEICGQLS